MLLPTAPPILSDADAAGWAVKARGPVRRARRRTTPLAAIFARCFELSNPCHNP